MIELGTSTLQYLTPYRRPPDYRRMETDKLAEDFVRQIEKTISSKRIERALDVLAYWIVRLGPDGEKCLPIYDRLENELVDMKKREERLRDIRKRVQRNCASSNTQ